MPLGVTVSELEDFKTLLEGWHSFLANSTDSRFRPDPFDRAVRKCASQLEEAINRAEYRHRFAAGDPGPAPITLGPVYEDPWHCMGCGIDYLGAEHDCPVRVRPLRGGIGLFGLDWTF
jgi:hypothetical protein